ncbi:UNVERIFIED_CONTAM: hypothetical protein H355_006276 [Colinus virginianus]|nr:hypothetical protein H355_006276 [Colinus virginianus]
MRMAASERGAAFISRHSGVEGAPSGGCVLCARSAPCCVSTLTLGPPAAVTAAVHLPAEYPRGTVPTLWNEPAELPSGSGPFDAATTARLSDATAFAPYTSELEPEDTTHLHRLDAGDGTGLLLGRSSLCVCSHLPGRPHPTVVSVPAGSLGPGAIGAIVIASLLGTSVLVALVVITLRKFSAS